MSKGNAAEVEMFQSTPHAREATIAPNTYRACLQVSIHASRAGGDLLRKRPGRPV